MFSPTLRDRTAIPSASFAAGAITYVSLLFLMRPYRGIFQDGRIYIGRTLANLDPAGVGRDPMFLHDAQTGFSLFPRIAVSLTASLGPSAASMLLVFAGLAMWGVAAAALGRRIAPGRDGWAAAVAILVLPAAYGGFRSFTYGEAWASPRAFAEALALLALAASAARRPLWAITAVLAAAAMHPLMALPAAAVLAVAAMLKDRRWIWLVLATLAAAAAAAMLGLPVAERLLRPVDPAWLRILQTRSPYLFPGLWPVPDWSRLAVQAFTLLIAARVTTSLTVRRLLLAILVVAILGVAAAAAASLFPSELLLQLQVWRSTWLLAALGNAAAPLALLALWRAGGLGRVAMAVLVCAWLSLDGLPGAGMAATAFGLALVAGRLSVAVSGRVVFAALASVGLLAAFWVVQRAAGAAQFVNMARASGAPLSWPLLMAAQLHAPIILGLAMAWALHARPIEGRGLRLAVPAALAALALWTWDSRLPFQRYMESGRARTDLIAAVGPVNGAIFWSDGDLQPWLLARQAAWFTPMQGGPMLFSRSLAMVLDERADRLLASGLDRPQSRAPFLAVMQPKPPIRGTAAGVASLCAAPDGPAAVVLNGRQLGAVPAGARYAVWSPAVPDYIFWDPARLAWRKVDAYTVIRCR